jgi:hypothetical protein
MFVWYADDELRAGVAAIKRGFVSWPGLFPQHGCVEIWYNLHRGEKTGAKQDAVG